VISRAVAKDPTERYQRGSVFARDLRQLRLQHTGSTTGFLMPRSLLDTKSLRPRPATATTGAEGGFEYVGRVVPALLRRVSARDLILGTAMVAVLVLASNAWKKNVVLRQAAAGPPVAAGVAPGTESATSSLPTEPPRPAPPSTTAGSTVASARSSAHYRTKLPVRSARSQQLVTDPVKEQPNLVSTSTIELTVQHQFKEATLSVWVDDQLALTLPLHGGTQKRLVVFHGLHGAGSETLRVPAGNHMLRVKAQSADQSINLSKTISTNFSGGDDKTLQITFDKRITTMYLNWH